MSIQVTALNVYPVKSLKGIALQKATLTAQGLAFDRHWMIINPKGKFVTQRQVPKMACIHTALTDEHLVLSCEGHGSLEIPLQARNDMETVDAIVWDDKCETLDEGDQASQWLTGILQTNYPLRLVRMATHFTRPQSSGEVLGDNTSTHFADAAPFLVANQGSLDALNLELEQQGLDPVPMNRFRPNVVVAGLDAFAEHGVDVLTQQQYQLAFCYPCERCIMTTIDQDLGTKHPEVQPFNTLKTLNTMPGKPHSPAFAENAVLASGDGGEICVGDELVVGLK